MKVDITRQNLASTLLLFAALCLVLWHRYAAAPIEALPGTALRMPLGGLLRGWGEALPGPLRNLAALGMLFIGGIWITRLIARNMILLERTYMPAIIFLIVGCGSWYDPAALDLFAATLLMIGSFDRTIGSFRREVVYTHIFNASLLLGIALLTYAPAAVYIPLLPVALVLFRKRWREWIVALAGLAGDAHRETRAGLSVDVRHFVAAHRRIDDEIAALEVQHPLRIIARIEAAQSRILPDKMEQCAERPDRAVTLDDDHVEQPVVDLGAVREAHLARRPAVEHEEYQRRPVVIDLFGTDRDVHLAEVRQLSQAAEIVSQFAEIVLQHGGRLL